jgi:hypothetical protein
VFLPQTYTWGSRCLWADRDSRHVNQRERLCGAFLRQAGQHGETELL